MDRLAIHPNLSKNIISILFYLLNSMHFKLLTSVSCKLKKNIFQVVAGRNMNITQNILFYCSFSYRQTQRHSGTKAFSMDKDLGRSSKIIVYSLKVRL